MHTEASHRFERGADPEAPAAATARIAHLLEKIGAGSHAAGARRDPRCPPRAALDPPAAGPHRPGPGCEGRESARVRHPRGLGFGVTEGPETAEVLVPSWRSDVAREDRPRRGGRPPPRAGQDSFHLPAARLPGGLNPAQARERRLRELLRGRRAQRGPESRPRRRRAVGRLRGRTGGEPGGEAREPTVLRPRRPAQRRSCRAFSATSQTNFRQGRRDVALFELGRVFAAAPKAAEPLPREERRLGLPHGGLRPPHWSERGTPADFFAAKGLLEALAARLDVPSLSVSDARELPPCCIRAGPRAVTGEGGPVGFVGALHPDLLSDARRCATRWWWPRW